ncbi:DUF1775 domain-containing protein [Conexibacter sp. W3-3-2]|uniref:YcnI family copper-binding membrane protein n=1 Tax=Conexibacter sp. W3-3-2 TaxID=2675227 RepID=UPI0012B8273B|nr:YcnI family protein [Conexibacter sp. W3-3-2]MTD45129.1 DUF1775 domain-containing protein [Conexibacter sp. W3-3-2]
MKLLPTLTAVAVLALPGVAAAHVTLQPAEGAAGAYVVENVRVPNEKEDSGTTKVVVQFPAGFESASTQPVPGWKAEVATSGGAVRTITWTASGDTRIGPGEFQDFPISIKLPDTEGPLTFKALQTYEDGETVRWIGDEASDKPAPTVMVGAASGDGHGASGHSDDGAAKSTETSESATAEPALASATTGGGDDGGDGLAIAALIVGGLGLLVGAAGLATARRAGSGA